MTVTLSVNSERYFYHEEHEGHEEWKKLADISIDELVKSRHSGENRSPDGLQLLVITGFRLSPE